MLIQSGQIVKSTSGRDQERFFIVLSQAEGMAFLVDGKLHKLEHPKRKNLKHLAPTARMVAVDQMTTDAAIRRVLAEYNRKGAASERSSEGGVEQHV